MSRPRIQVVDGEFDFLKAAAKRLMGKYATCEAEVDDLLRHGVFIDLYAVVRQGFVIGTPSYSLKAAVSEVAVPTTVKSASASRSLTRRAMNVASPSARTTRTGFPAGRLGGVRPR